MRPAGASRCFAVAALLVAGCGERAPAIADAAPPIVPDAAPADAGESLGEQIARVEGDPRIGRRYGPSAGLVSSEVELLEGEDESVNVEGILHSFFWAGVERCYDKAFARDPKLHGRVVVTFSLNRYGKVSQSEVKGFDAELDACIAARVKKWHFPIKEGPKRYRAPFELNKNPQERRGH